MILVRPGSAGLPWAMTWTTVLRLRAPRKAMTEEGEGMREKGWKEKEWRRERGERREKSEEMRGGRRR